MKGLRLALWALTLPSADLNAADLSQPFCLRGVVSDLAWSRHCDLLSLGPWMWLPDGSSPSFLHQALHSWLLVWLWFFSTAFSGQTMTVLTSSVCFFFIASHWISLYPGILGKTRHTDYKVQLTTLNGEATPVLLFFMSGVGSCYGLEVFMLKYSYTDWQLDPQCGDLFKKWDLMSGSNLRTVSMLVPWSLVRVRFLSRRVAVKPGHPCGWLLLHMAVSLPHC